MITGKEYAAFEKTDAATAFGMRLAMAEAVIRLKGDERAGKIKPNEFAKKAKAYLRESAENDDFLKAAGTEKLVANYFERVVDRQADPAAAVKKFMEALSGITEADIKAARKGELADDRLSWLGSGFLKSARNNLGIKTITEDFRDELAKGAITKDVTITPNPLSEELAKKLSGMETSFRRLDAIDNAASKIGLGSPAVAHLIAKTDTKDEAKITLALKADLPKDLRPQVERTIVEMRADKKGVGALEALLDKGAGIKFPKERTVVESLNATAALLAGMSAVGVANMLNKAFAGNNPSMDGSNAKTGQLSPTALKNPESISKSTGPKF